MEILESFERKYEIKLPQLYKAWFYKGGPQSESFIGTDADESYLPQLRGWATELLNDCHVNFELPSNAFVFAMHQGYEFMYFLCDGNDDPEVWYYFEGESEPYIKWKSLSDLLQNT